MLLAPDTSTGQVARNMAFLTISCWFLGSIEPRSEPRQSQFRQAYLPARVYWRGPMWSGQ